MDYVTSPVDAIFEARARKARLQRRADPEYSLSGENVPRGPEFMAKIPRINSPGNIESAPLDPFFVSTRSTARNRLTDAPRSRTASKLRAHLGYCFVFQSLMSFLSLCTDEKARLSRDVQVKRVQPSEDEYLDRFDPPSKFQYTCRYYGRRYS